MAELVRERMVLQVAPGAHIYEFPNFTSAFVTHVEQLRQTQVLAPKTQWVRIHIEKVGDIGHELCLLGVAEPHDYPWYRLEPSVARDFMAYLVGVLRQVDDYTEFEPVTDRTDRLRVFEPGKQMDGFELREILLENLLPTPAGNVRPGDLNDFKKANAAALRAFRRRIEGLVSEVSGIADRRARTARINYLVNELAKKEKTWRIRWRSLEGGCASRPGPFAPSQVVRSRSRAASLPKIPLPWLVAPSASSAPSQMLGRLPE
jgi:hypothetical protein